MGRRGSATVRVNASPARVYALIADIGRMGEWSPETIRAEWLGGATGPAPGVRFKGTNRLGVLRWSTRPFVEVAEPGRELTFTTGTPRRPYTRWRYALTPAGDGTDVEESWEEVNRLPLIGRFLMTGARARQLDEGCATTLGRIKAAAEASAEES